MKKIKSLKRFFVKKRAAAAPVLIIKKDTDEKKVKEFDSIEEAIADLENDPNVSSEKIERLKTSIKQLKNKTTIKIMNGEIIIKTKESK